MFVDACGVSCVLPREEDAVLVGSAITAATAAGLYNSIEEAMKQMTETESN